MSAFETLIGIKGKGFAIIAADAHMAAHQIIAIKDDESKIYESDGKCFGIIGPSADRTQFAEIVIKNMALYRLKNGVSLSPHAAATWTRNVLANALRRGPYQIDMLCAGYDQETEDASLYFVDMYASLAKVNKAAHSYAGNFCLSILDKEWKMDMTLAEGKAAIKKCIDEVRTRFVLGRLNEFTIKCVSKDGVQELKYDDL